MNENAFNPASFDRNSKPEERAHNGQVGKTEFSDPWQALTQSQPDVGQLANRYPHNLPAQLSPMVGREQETRDLISLCAHPEIRLITIRGLGGSGKTRLAVEVARNVLPLFEHGCWLIPLSSTSAPEFLPEAVCSALNLPHSSRTNRKTQLLDFLFEKNILLVWDYLEHLLPQALPLLTEILEHAPSVKILATSSVKLGAPGEHVFRLRGLRVPKSGKIQELESYGAFNLFAEQLRRIGYPLQETDYPAAIQVCRLAEGMPLALIMAANWGRVMTCPEIVEELERGQRLSTLNTSAPPEKHTSLRVVFEDSWRLLSDEEQTTLRRLAALASGFDREAAARIAGAEVGMLAALLDKSMIERREEKGFEIHDLLRQFLEEKLVDAGEQAVVRDAHLSYYCELAERAEPELYSHNQTTWCERLDAQYQNLYSALSWGLAPDASMECPERFENGVRLAQALWYYWHLRWGWQEGRKWYTQCLATSTNHMPALVQVRAYAYAAIFESIAGDWNQAIEWADRALYLAIRHEIDDGIALALLRKGGVVRMKDSLQGRALIEQALEMYRQLQHPFYTSAALFYLGQAYADTPAEQNYYTECLELSLKNGNKRYAAFTLFNLGGMACYRGDLYEARSCHEKSYRLMKELKDVGGLMFAANLLGRDQLHLKAFDQAGELFQECLQIAETTGDRAMVAQAYINFGHLNRALGDLTLAEEHFNQSLLVNEEFGETSITIRAYHGLGLAALDAENDRASVFYLRKALALHQKIPAGLDFFDWMELVDSLAASFSANGQFAKAAILFSAVTSLFATAGYHFHPHIQENHDRWLAHARQQLGPKAFEKAWRRGLSLKLEDAIHFALEPDVETAADENAQTISKYPAGLTVREVDVLRLVSQGLTDAQIAKELVLSTRTVNAHLTSIYKKLGVSSRAAATRYAVEQGLVP